MCWNGIKKEGGTRGGGREKNERRGGRDGHVAVCTCLTVAIPSSPHIPLLKDTKQKKITRISIKQHYEHYSIIRKNIKHLVVKK